MGKDDSNNCVVLVFNEIKIEFLLFSKFVMSEIRKKKY